MSSQPGPSDLVSAQGNYAGSVSRLTAYVIDLAVSTGLYWLVLTFASFVAQIITGHPVSWHRNSIIVVVLYVVWEFLYFGRSWAAAGRTLGMGILGVRVVRADGAPLEARRGWLRSLTFPLGFLTLGLGFLGILLQREHRAVYDLIADSAVVYEWDARAARLRFLAREAEAPGGPALGHAGHRRAAAAAQVAAPETLTVPDGEHPAGEDHPPRVTQSEPQSGNR